MRNRSIRKRRGSSTKLFNKNIRSCRNDTESPPQLLPPTLRRLLWRHASMRHAVSFPAGSRPCLNHISIPHGTSTEIHDLKSLSAKEVSDVLKKAKTSKVGFVILNAPFKVR